MRRWPALFALAALLLFVGSARAHGMRTASLRIDEVGPTRALVRFSAPVADAAEPVLPGDCASAEASEIAGVYTLDCPDGLAGRTFGARGLGAAVNDATVFVRFRDERTASHLLTAAAPTWDVPREDGALDVVRSYVRAGVLHIARGADHLLFLALLVLILRRPRAVLLAETAFTLSHSLAFTATALGWLRVRPAPVEACIALSLVLLALDLARAQPASSARGAGLALVFGLVHGLGFAGGLREAGLPDAHAAIALLGFGAGVEIGQIAFLVLALVVTGALARLRAFPRIVNAAATAIGGIATAWLIERVLQSFTA